MTAPLAIEERKSLGAFYTDETIVRFLTAWGMREPGRAVMDPSCGDGRFLEAAARGGADRLVGCDIASQALAAARNRLAEFGPRTRLVAGDFFVLGPEEIAPVDLVVGNPPFIRYQRFQGESRRRALESALRLGVRLNRLASSWAPFLLHAIQFLRPGGDLAMVVPAEITQTRYGLATLRALLRHFRAIRLLTFEHNLFTEALTETCLLLAAGYGGHCCEVQLIPLGSGEDLETLAAEDLEPATVVEVPMGRGADMRFAQAFLKPAEHRTWERVKKHAAVRSVVSLATVINGYVSGDNRFFHRCRTEFEAAGYPVTWLLPTARGARSLRGIEFTLRDVGESEARGVPHHLVVPRHDLFDSDGEALRRFLAEGKTRGVPRRYKCRVREPWWQVPGLQQADVLVSYMAGACPRAAVNRADAYYSNSLHGLKLRPGVSAELLALSFYSSLTLLSLEIEGRSYGGGILKVEPRELDRVLVAWPETVSPRLATPSAEVDEELRAGNYQKAVAQVDAALLEGILGFSARSVRLLRSARERLAARRAGRARKRGQ